MTPHERAEAIVRVAVAPLLAEPRISSHQVSQCLAGQIVQVVGRQGEWMRVRGSDGFEGWMYAGYGTPALLPGGRRSSGLDRISLGCVARTSDGARRALPFGAVLAPEETVKFGEAIFVTDQPARFPAEPIAITRSAQEYFEGAPYLWGGITPWGADCSGFVQAIFGIHGVALPRDASQQAATGVRSPHALVQMSPAELAFFSERDDRAVTHVGIGLGGGRMVHLAIGRGGYAIERLADGSDAFVSQLHERFLFVQQVV